MENWVLVLLVFIGILFAVGVILLIRALYEPHKLVVTSDELDSGSDSNPDISICYFSDLHAELCFITPEKLISAIDAQNKVKPVDMVIFGGDVCNKKEKASKGINYLKKVSDYCKANDILFLGVTGNHDVALKRSEIDSCGFINLSKNDFIFTSKSGKKYFITGVSDSGRKNRVWYEVNTPKEDVDATVLIAHNPDYINHLKGNTNVDYMLSGHIHGGQIRTPFKLEFKLRDKDELPRIGIYSGKHVINNCKVFISKGLGCVVFPFRLGVYPELNVLSIKKTNR